MNWYQLAICCQMFHCPWVCSLYTCIQQHLGPETPLPGNKWRTCLWKLSVFPKTTVMFALLYERNSGTQSFQYSEFWYFEQPHPCTSWSNYNIPPRLWTRWCPTRNHFQSHHSQVERGDSIILLGLILTSSNMQIWFYGACDLSVRLHEILDRSQGSAFIAQARKPIPMPKDFGMSGVQGDRSLSRCVPTCSRSTGDMFSNSAE
jgi:hypothetical protein